jgi:hypothetical protein
VEGIGVLQRRLGGLDESQLAALLERRADVLAGVPPQDLREVAQRLWHPHSLVFALRDSSLPCLQVAEAAQALGDGCTRASLAELLDGDSDGDGGGHRDAVGRIIDELITNAVLAADGPDRLCVPAAFAEIFPSPLGLGEPLVVLLSGRPVDEMRRIQTVLGIEKQKNRADTVAALLAYLGNPDAVRSVVADAPPEVVQYLTALATGAPRPEADDYDPQRYRVQKSAIEWAGERGLLMGARWEYDWQMPAEVARALRGVTYRAPFNPDRPDVATRPVDLERVERDSAAAATLFADHLLAVLDYIARAPLASVKAGGVGARELARLAKATGTDEVVLRLVLELADELSLLTRSDSAIVVSDEFGAWRDLDPPDRFAAVLAAWWTLGMTPTETRDSDGKTLRALARPGECAGCRAARASLLTALADLDQASSCVDVARAALWQRPLVHVVAQDEHAPLATVWREAELLGLIADDTLGDLGRAVHAGNATALVKYAAALLPHSADHATFGSDLTAYVVGAPSARLSDLLDSAADRESRGGAITWRFSPTSVRRAFDDGTTGEALTAKLGEIATGPLPQPLRFLIGDVARRHGNLRLGTATTCIQSEDAALLAEVAADRKLAKLGLRLLAPTVLVSEAPVARLLAALRAAGYFPVVDVATIDPLPSGVRNRGTGTHPPSRAQIRQLYPDPPRADPHALAAELLRGGRGKARPETATPTEQLLSQLAKSLSVPEIRQLAHAVDTKSRVRIEYNAATGGVTRRVIEQPELIGNSLYAWCELRADDRIFTVTRIQSVTAI